MFSAYIIDWDLSFTAVKSEHLYVFLTNAYNSVCLIFKNLFLKYFYFGVGFLVLFCHFGFVVLWVLCVFLGLVWGFFVLGNSK